MFLKKCIVCGKEFTPTANQQTICSQECRKVRKREREREYYRYGRRLEKRICAVCGKEFETGTRSGVKICSPKCRVEYCRQYAAKRRRGC